MLTLAIGLSMLGLGLFVKVNALISTKRGHTNIVFHNPFSFLIEKIVGTNKEKE